MAYCALLYLVCLCLESIQGAERASVALSLPISENMISLLSPATSVFSDIGFPFNILTKLSISPNPPLLTPLVEKSL